MIRLVQLRHPEQGRRIAKVEGEHLRLVEGYPSVYAAALSALIGGVGVETLLSETLSVETLAYDPIYAGESEWQLLPAFDHPDEPSRCLVAGTGLTHRKGAENRNAMHKEAAQKITDSMQMYLWGEEGGRPASGEIGAQPEWFYKGCGTILRAHGEPLEVPDFAEDGGEEPEIAVLYVIDRHGKPWRIGFAVANEFSDHQMERRNYLYLAPSKLRNCSLGPELVVGGSFGDVPGQVSILRNGETLWTCAIASGEEQMVHTLENLEYHHFKYPAHRRPGDAHVHFFGTGAFSFGAGIALEAGDIMEITFEGYGRPLRNPLHVAPKPAQFIGVGDLAQ